MPCAALLCCAPSLSGCVFLAEASRVCWALSLNGKAPGMPTRRTMELIVITVVLLHPVIRMAHIWAAKHLATSNNPATTVVAEVIATVV